MSYPTQAGNLRTITTNNIQYRWRFSTRATESMLIVYGPSSGRQPLSVALLNWQDEWLIFPESTDNQPKHIGPVFVREAIKFGLANGWQPEKRGRALKIEWSNGQFSVGN